MADEVFTTGNANVQAFTAATQHARSRGDAAEAERAATEAARLALPGQVTALTAPGIQAATQAADAARAAAVTLPKFRSTTTTNPAAPTQAELDAHPNGIGGLRLTAEGGAQQLRWTPHTLTGAWVGVGEPSLTVTGFQNGLRLRQGLNLRDYAQFVVGDDWTPAWNQMIAAAGPNDRISAIGAFVFRSTVRIDKPVELDLGAAEFIAVGAGFVPAGFVAGTAIQITLTEPVGLKPLLDIYTMAGNGSFGDNEAFGKWAVLCGTLPTLRRENAHATFQDGSVGLRTDNLYYSKLQLSPINDFHTGIWATASRGRGMSHCEVALSRLGNVRNVVLESHGGEARQAGGWITTNSFYKGGFGSPDFLGRNAQQAGETFAQWTARVVPDEHTHITSIGADLGWHYSNVFYDPYFENYGVRAWDGIGIQASSGVIMDSETGYEMPEADRRGNAWARLRADANGGIPRYSRFIGGMPAEQVMGGLGTITEIAGYLGWRQSFDGRSMVWPENNLAEMSLGHSEWFLPAPFLQEPKVYFLSAAHTAATPLVLDVGKWRRFQLSLPAGLSVPAGAVVLSNPPTTMDADLEIIVQQDTGNTVHPDWLVGIRYGSGRAPVRRDYGTDRYLIRLPKGEPQRMVTSWFSRNQAAPPALAAAPAWAAPAPASAALTVSAAYAQAEVQAIAARLEQVRARAAEVETRMQAQIDDLAAKLRAAGVLG